VILYPLNALVEDQLRRLRTAIDDEDVHRWLDRDHDGNRITFGRYTGLTPIAGTPAPQKITRLRKELQDLDQQRREVLAALQADPTLDPDVKFYFPRLDGGEMWSRWDMQETPPDILITNYSMLNIMMMRSIENNIFDATRDWLAEDGHPEREFFLIIDELHAYRGTPGTEVAYILRLLLSRLGLTPDSPKLRILTTTASLEDNLSGRKFLREFFGRDQFAFISGQQIDPPAGARFALIPYQQHFEEFARKVQPTSLAGPPNPNDNDTKTEMGQLADRLGEPRGKETVERLGDALVRIQAPDALRDACKMVHNGIVRPTQAPHLDQQLFLAAAATAANDILASDALRGVLLALGMSRLKTTLLQSARSPQPVRGHLFFHHLLNLWACCNPDCTAANQAERAKEPGARRPTIGALHSTHRIACTCGSRILDLIVCEVCGDVFVGGYKAKRPIGTRTCVILTPDQPDLEHMPDRVSLDQRHGQYAVFWPLPHDQPAWSTKALDSEWTVDKIKRKWEKAKLNRATGELIQSSTAPSQDEIPGWLYHVVGNQADNQPSMPTKCPRCDADYHARKTFKTPLRNHRTGFQKACQVIASALFREMELDAASSKSRKLVIFSDSRQDAAKLAAGMERDHFRDMVRLTLIQTFREYWPNLVAFLRVTFASNRTNLPLLQSLNPTLYTEVAKPQQLDDIIRQQRFTTAHTPVVSEALMWFMNMPPVNQQARTAWIELLQAYPGRIPLANLRGAVGDTLLAWGICPGGSEFTTKHYRSGPGQWEPWYASYDWTNPLPVPQVNASLAQTNHITRMGNQLTGELMYALFPHSARTLEGLGQGSVSYRPYSNPSPDTISTTDAVIRLMAIKRLHQYSFSFYAGTENRLRPFTLGYINNRGITEPEVQEQLVRSEAGIPSSSGLALAPDKLTLLPPPEKINGARPGYRCPQCNAFYLHNVVNCPGCEQVTAVVQDTTTPDFDYYTTLTERADATCFRMNCEELTGQTDRDVRPKRQRWFQDVFIANEIKKVQGVDLLSVTTTMEAGVDIGALNAVMMANMPPRRFNYQQRVGRAGRRGSGVSLAVTFCRGRSHDDFYYQRPESITGDPPPSPYVDMRSEPIFKRVLIKEVLRQAFASTKTLMGVSDGDNVHGEFGLAEKWGDYRQDIDNWLYDPANQPAIESILQTLSIETPWAGVAGNTFRAEMLKYLHNDLIADITKIASDLAYTQDALSERLSNAGLLPMFGFPTRVRLLYTRWPRQAYPWPPEAGTVDRDLDLAISQFAPGSQTVKDKAVHTAAGVVALQPIGGIVSSEDGFYPPLPQGNDTPIGLCDKCQAVVPLSPLPAPAPGNIQPAKQVCPVCKQPELRPLDVREPKGFFTDLEPQDFDGQFEWHPRSTRPSLSINTSGGVSTTQVGNSSVVTLTDRILSVNDDGGKGGFDFRRTRVDNQVKQGAYAVAPPPSTGSTASALTIGDRISVADPAYRVALISRRMTDILLVNIDNWPTGVFADPTTVEGRAAWYSFAFWLRLAAGAHMDVDALELQASFRTLPDPVYSAIGQAFLCDQLENGAGYCRFLADSAEFKQLLQQGDPNTSNSIAAKWTTLTTSAGPVSGHGVECDTSCNLCLRDFHNLPYHGLLDWRLALDMARLAEYPTATIDLTSPWSTTTNPWTTIVSATSASAPATLQRLGYSAPVQFGSLRGYVHQNPTRRTVLIERHPLWNDQHPDWSTAYADATAKHPGCKIQDLNPFRLLRRPADYV